MVFGRGPRSSADKPLFGTRRSRPNFCDRLALGRRQAHNFLIEVSAAFLEVRPTSRFSAQVAGGRTSLTDWPRNAATEISRHFILFGRVPRPGNPDVSNEVIS